MGVSSLWKVLDQRFVCIQLPGMYSVKCMSGAVKGRYGMFTARTADSPTALIVDWVLYLGCCATVTVSYYSMLSHECIVQV